jgi:hypothetical protein
MAWCGGAEVVAPATHQLPKVCGDRRIDLWQFGELGAAIVVSLGFEHCDRLEPVSFRRPKHT